MADENINKKIKAEMNLAKEELDSAEILLNADKYRDSITHCD